ncbi:MAG: ribbon-helix-helix protein, CopG family [Candidatus Binatia bacterium]|jgi:predicted transcriptional regulator
MKTKKQQEAPQRTTMYLDRALHKRLKYLAVDRGTTVTAIITEALIQYLEREQSMKGERKR